MPSPKCARVERLHLQDFPGLELDLADARPAVQARAFVQDAVAIDQPLREGLAIVRIRSHDLVTERGHPAPRLRRTEKADRAHDHRQEKCRPASALGYATIMRISRTVRVAAAG